MRFKDTKRFAPVIYGGDTPWEYDLYHIPVSALPMTEKGMKDFLSKNPEIEPDIVYWEKQKDRCLNGFKVENAIEPGGDYLVDGKDVFWNETDKDVYVKEIDKILPANSCYVPQYDWMFYNREVWITGRHYFYLNFWKVIGLPWGDESIVLTDTRDEAGKLNKKEIQQFSFKESFDLQSAKDYVNPKFTDVDYWYAIRLFYQVYYQKDGLDHKSRQKGFSEKGGGMILGWNFTFVPNSLSIVAGGMSTDAEHTVENAIKGLRQLRNTQFYKEVATDPQQSRKAKYFGSEIFAVSCKDNTQALSRYTPFWVIVEEVGKWKAGLIHDVKEFVEVSLEAEGRKTGYMNYIGTGGDMDMGAQDLEHMFENPSNYNLLEFKHIWEPPGQCPTFKVAHFTPYYLYLIIDKDGNSLVQMSMDFAMMKRSKLSGSKLYTHRTQRPFYASEAFLISGGGYFGEEITQWCNERITQLKLFREERRAVRGYFSWKTDRKNWKDGVEFHQTDWDDEKAYVEIYEHPEVDSNKVVYKNLYWGATDSYDQDEATTDSMGSCSIKKGFLNAHRTYNKYVAQLLERPRTAEGGRDRFYEHTAMLCVYYGAMNLIEYSKMFIIDWYQLHGFTELLRRRPRFFTAKYIINSRATNDFGIDPSSKPFWLKAQRDWLQLKQNIEDCDSILMLTRWAKFRYDPGKTKFNCDVTISTSLCSVLYEEVKEESAYSESDRNKAQGHFSPHYKKVKGRLVLSTTV